MNRDYDKYIREAAQKHNLSIIVEDEIIKTVSQYILKFRKSIDPKSQYGPTLGIPYLGKLFLLKNKCMQWYGYNGQSEEEAAIRFEIRLRFLLLSGFNGLSIPKAEEDTIYEEIKKLNINYKKRNSLTRIINKLIKQNRN